MLHVAIVGAGPSGFYAADELTRAGHHVDIIERLPAPFGLLRYGVAPDHLKIKSTALAFEKVMTRHSARFAGNIEVGRDVSIDQLRDAYDAVILASGTPGDRMLGIPGESLPGSYAARSFVAWYNGHPDHVDDQYRLNAASAAVVGAGNVALDVARLLVRRVADLSSTDCPEDVLRALGASSVRDVYLLIRRGPVHTRFSSKELAELGELPDVDIVVKPQDLVLSEFSRRVLDEDSVAARNYETLSNLSARRVTGTSSHRRRIHFEFFRRPVEVCGDASGVRQVRTEITAVDHRGVVTGTGIFDHISAGLLFRSVGYQGRRIDGAPFDETTATIPNAAGRVISEGSPVPGLYVAGWIKRGPSGVIGTNRADSKETVRSLLEDLGADGQTRATPDIIDRMIDEGHAVIDWNGWMTIDAVERALGTATSRTRVKLHSRDALLRAGLNRESTTNLRHSGARTA